MASHGSDVTCVITEQVNPRTRDIDRLSIEGILGCVLAEDATVAAAVEQALPAIARAAQLLDDTLARQGRWFNLGAGTSERLGMLDAAELPPTYGIEPDQVQAILAGGPQAMMTSVEGAEDDPREGGRMLRARGFCERDALLAISASGRTPFVLGALEHATTIGAPTIGLTCCVASALARAVACPIVVEVGPEAIAGSTRMKGGVAQKMVLHMLSTTVMVRRGRVCGNLMTRVRVRSDKLRERARRIVAQLGAVDPERAQRALDATQGSVADALEWLQRQP